VEHLTCTYIQEVPASIPDGGLLSSFHLLSDNFVLTIHQTNPATDLHTVISPLLQWLVEVIGESKVRFGLQRHGMEG
jgi:hypothetical protein